MYRLVTFLLVLLLAACAPAAAPDPGDGPEPTRTPGGPTLTPVSFIPPDAPAVQGTELLRLEGNGPGEGVLQLQSETTLRVHWQNFGEQRFQVFLVNTDQQAEAQYQKISVALSAAPSIGYTDGKLAAGEYRIVVETSEGEWLVWAEAIQP